MSISKTGGECSICHETYRKLYAIEKYFMKTVEICSKKCFDDLKSLREEAEKHIKLSRHFRGTSIVEIPKKEDGKKEDEKT